MIIKTLLAKISALNLLKQAAAPRPLCSIPLLRCPTPPRDQALRSTPPSLRANPVLLCLQTAVSAARLGGVAQEGGAGPGWAGRASSTPCASS